MTSESKRVVLVPGLHEELRRSKTEFKWRGPNNEVVRGVFEGKSVILEYMYADASSAFFSPKNGTGTRMLGELLAEAWERGITRFRVRGMSPAMLGLINRFVRWEILKITHVTETFEIIKEPSSIVQFRLFLLRLAPPIEQEGREN
ncbi:MAG: hypothetical protein PHI12_11145 [Dehalococcoidales bacterium]|nr:hypothetical protein [Dehalococcoidales bacterium]